MPAPGKRALSPAKSISPPPLRRKRSPPPPIPNTIPSAGAGQGSAAARSPSSSSQPSSPSHIRIFSWNVNGIAPFLQKPITSFFTPPKPSPTTSSPSAPGYTLRNFLRRHAWPQLLCLQEVKINPRDETTQRALSLAANSDGVHDAVGPGYTAHYCLPRDKYNARGFGGKVYGVATFIRDDFLAEHVLRTREVEWDVEGRVLVTELREKVVVINGYWVNGTMNAWKSAETGAILGTRHDRKRAFHRLMLEECLRYESEGWSVVLVGDMNIARGPLDGFPGIRLGTEHVLNRADFNKKFFTNESGLRGVDVWRHLHGERRKYTYRGRDIEWGSSMDRVDLIVVSRAIVEKGALVATDILDEVAERGHSDHVPLFVTLDLEKLRDEDNVDQGVLT